MAEFNPTQGDEIDESMMDHARTMAAQIGDPFAVLRAAIEQFTAVPSESLTDVCLSADVIRLRAQIGRLEAIFAEYTLGSHRRGLCGHDAMRSTPAWLAWQTGLARGQVRRAIDTAELAELLPTIGAAWRDGRVSTNAMEAIAAARVPGHDEKLAACEDEFYDLARRGDHKGVRRAAEAFKHLARADGTIPIEPDGFRLSKVLNGRSTISGELSGDAAETVTTAVNASWTHPQRPTTAPPPNAALMPSSGSARSRYTKVPLVSEPPRTSPSPSTGPPSPAVAVAVAVAVVSGSWTANTQAPSTGETSTGSSVTARSAE